MTRDPVLLADCAALRRELARYPSLAALRESPEGFELELRLRKLLSNVRRYQPAAPPGPPSDDERVLAVHWNVEHGNRYELVEQALLSHVQLAGVDLLLLNEVDLGMARAGNRDVTADLVRALGLYGAWAPLFLETTLGRDDDPRMAAGHENQESLFGLAILSRWPLGEVRLVDLPSPEESQFDIERMYGRHVGLVAEILRPGAPFLAVSAHLEVHRTREHRTAQMRTLLRTLKREPRPILLAGDFNSHTFDRGRRWSPFLGGLVLLTWPGGMLRKRLLYPDRGGHRETLFDALRDANFEWQRFNDRRPTLDMRFDRIDEARGLQHALAPLTRPVLARAERRAKLRLDWFAGRGWHGGHGATVLGLNGPGKASDHAPIVADFH